MNRHLLLSVAAAAVLGLGLQGCTKNQTTAAGNTAEGAATTTGAAASNAVDASGNTVASTEGTGPVSDVQDMASGAVGMASAASPTDAAGFVTAAGVGNMYEIEAAKIAETKATSAPIKAFAKQMVADHTKAGAELKSIVGKPGMTATVPTALDERRQGLIDNLKTTAAGQDFDKRYVNQQVAAHREMETLLKGFAEHGDNPALKTFAAKTAVTVQHHLDMANKLDAMPANASKAAG